MYTNTVNQYLLKERPFNLVTGRNQLGIEKIDFIRDKRENLLILMMTVKSRTFNDIYSFIKGTKLIVESSVPLNINTDCLPLRTHLIDREICNEAFEGTQHIGFSEIRLKQGYKYKVLSSGFMSQQLIKIVLSYKPLYSN